MMMVTQMILRTMEAMVTVTAAEMTAVTVVVAEMVGMTMTGVLAVIAQLLNHGRETTLVKEGAALPRRLHGKLPLKLLLKLPLELLLKLPLELLLKLPSNSSSNSPSNSSSNSPSNSPQTPPQTPPQSPPPAQNPGRNPAPSPTSNQNQAAPSPRDPAPAGRIRTPRPAANHSQARPSRADPPLQDATSSNHGTTHPRGSNQIPATSTSEPEPRDPAPAAQNIAPRPAANQNQRRPTPQDPIPPVVPRPASNQNQSGTQPRNRAQARRPTSNQAANQTEPHHAQSSAPRAASLRPTVHFAPLPLTDLVLHTDDARDPHRANRMLLRSLLNEALLRNPMNIQLSFVRGNENQGRVRRTMTITWAVQIRWIMQGLYLEAFANIPVMRPGHNREDILQSIIDADNLEEADRIWHAHHPAYGLYNTPAALQSWDDRMRALLTLRLDDDVQLQAALLATGDRNIVVLPHSWENSNTGAILMDLRRHLSMRS
ncbi:hypothetical protein BT69DRAFT_1050871 [Atractiella rhizophila]|nr:hypothetical protein BT69DRAFT_1050871 [Atractiella rhizophila]